MEIAELEKLAVRGSELPKDLAPPEVMLYYMLSGLYARYQTKKIDRECAVRHKQRIMSVYKRLRDDYEQFTAVCREYQSRLRNGYQVSGVKVVEQA